MTEETDPPSYSRERTNLLSAGALFPLINAFGTRTRKRFYPDRVRAPLYKSSPIEDLLYGQPVNLPLRLLRHLYSLNSTESSGVSIVIVNYNTTDLLKVTLPAIRRFCHGHSSIIVVDNDSKDGGWQWLRQRPHGIRAIRLPVNVGHGRALDLGFALARTKVVLTLDADAFPISERWLPAVLEPLADPALLAVGSWGRRDRLHPAFAAYKRSAVMASGLSFTNYKPHLDSGEPIIFGRNCWDTGELIYQYLGGDRVILLPVKTSPNGWGEIISDVVYHHRAMTGYDKPSHSGRDDILFERRRLWDIATSELLNQPPR